MTAAGLHGLRPLPPTGRLRPLWLAWALLVPLFMPLLAPLPARGQTPVADINLVKAAYLHRFVGYVQWPPAAFESPASPLVVGVAGNEAVYAELVRLAARRTPPARAMQVRELAAGDDLQGLHVLFAAAGGSELADWTARAQGHPVLLVSDAPDGLERGVALNFVVVDRRLRFEASRAAFERAQLKASAHLLALATRVVDGR